MSADDFGLTEAETQRITDEVMSNLAAIQRSKAAPVVANITDPAELYRIHFADEKRKREAQAPQYRPPTEQEVADFTRNTSDTGKLWDAVNALYRIRRDGR